MKNVVFFIVIIVLCLSGCQLKSQKSQKDETHEEISTKAVAPTTYAEQRAGKFALIVNDSIATGFEYDSVDLTKYYPVLTKKDKHFVFLKGKLVGPFDNLSIVNKDVIKISKEDHKLNGFFYVKDSHEDLFNYPKVEIEPVEAYGVFTRGLYWIQTESGKKGLISTDFAVENQSFILPLDDYIYTDVKSEIAYVGIIITQVSVKYYKESAVGEIYCFKAILGGNEKPERVVKNVNIIKLEDLFEANAKIIAVNKAKNALIQSKKGYGLINFSGDILVPIAYDNYQNIGDSAYVFSNNIESIKVNLNGIKI